MSEAHEHSAFYQEVFGRTFDSKASNDKQLMSETDVKNLVVKTEPRAKEEFLDVINYTYDTRRRDRLYPTLASVTTYAQDEDSAKVFCRFYEMVSSNIQ